MFAWYKKLSLQRAETVKEYRNLVGNLEEIIADLTHLDPTVRRSLIRDTLEGRIKIISNRCVEFAMQAMKGTLDLYNFFYGPELLHQVRHINKLTIELNALYVKRIILKEKENAEVR